MNEGLRRDHKELLESLISGKLPRNLSWKSVIDLIGNISARYIRKGTTSLSSRSAHKDVSSSGPAGMISQLRKYLDYAGF